jgi:hypothetical protein
MDVLFLPLMLLVLVLLFGVALVVLAAIQPTPQRVLRRRRDE